MRSSIGDKPVIFSDLHCFERMPLPPIAAIAQGRPERVVFRPAVLPPLLAIGEQHGVVASDGFILFLHPCQLIC